MGQTTFHRRQWLSVQQTVNHLSAVAEEPLTSEDLADLAEEHQLDLYWYRPGQLLTYMDGRGTRELHTPLLLCAESRSDWQALVGILRHRPALPAYEQDTPLLEDAEGNRLRITFERGQRPEPFSSRWYPTLAELVLKRSQLELLESRIFPQGPEGNLGHQLLLNVIWELEQLALGASKPRNTPAWLADELVRRNGDMDRSTLERVLAAAEREGARQAQ